jgi:hypothetical protein
VAKDNRLVTCLDDNVSHTTKSEIMTVILELSGKRHDQAINAMAAAESLAQTSSDQAWLHLGRARLARFDGDEPTAQSELAAARQLLAYNPLDSDWNYGLSFAYAQFLQFAIPRQLLPQVYYPIDDPSLLRLLNEATP